MLHILLFVFAIVVIFFGDEIVKVFRRPKRKAMRVPELDDRHITMLMPGHFMVVVLLTEASENGLLRKFVKEVLPFRKINTLHFSFLNIDDHRDWMSTLLNISSDVTQNDRPADEHEETSDYIGHVLAINGHERYFSVFCPAVAVGDPSDTSSMSDSSLTVEDWVNGRWIQTQRSTVDFRNRLNKLRVWLVKVMDGAVPKLQVPDWPSVDEP